MKLEISFIDRLIVFCKINQILLQIRSYVKMTLEDSPTRKSFVLYSEKYFIIQKVDKSDLWNCDTKRRQKRLTKLHKSCHTFSWFF